MSGPDDPRWEVPAGALAELGEQLRAATERRGELLSMPPAPPAPPADPGVPLVGDADVVPLRSRRRGWRVAAMSAAAAVAAVVAVSIVGDPAPQVAAGVTVVQDGPSVTVTIDDQARLDEVEAALSDAGVRATLEPRTTGPSRVGRFVGIVGTDSRLLGEGGSIGSAATFDAGDAVTLFFGTAADEGETYDVPTDAFASGEPFADVADQVLGVPWEQARPVLEGVDAGVRVDVVGAPSGRVTGVQMVASDRARVLLD